MAHVQWEIKGREFGNCNCSYGCPCQFNALPTHGHCRGAYGWQVDQGTFGAVKLDGLRAAGLYIWPGPVHQGNGTMQLIVDERARPEQRGGAPQDHDRPGHRRHGHHVVGLRGHVSHETRAAI